MKKTFHTALTGMIAVLAMLAAPLWALAQLEDPIPNPIEPGGPPVRLETVATGLTAPNWGTYAPGHPNHLYVADQVGILWGIHLVSGDKIVFADLSGLLVPLGAFGPGTFDERGFLGVAFHPDYMSNGLLYTYTSEPASGADFPVPLGDSAQHESVITEWQVPDPSNPVSVVDPASRRVLIRIGQPQFNHNGGALGFGPDNMLYIALGDGGAADDQGPGHMPQGNGQAPGNILGNILRIDPLGANSLNGQYAVPSDNPFFPGGTGPYGGQPGCGDGFCDEIYAYGFRNPFRMSFDMDNGDLYAAEVGQNDIEEVDVIVAGGNYGWRVKEGSFCFDPNGPDRGFVEDPALCEDSDLIDPIAEYDHDEGISIIGGFVYRGNTIPGLRGRYVFGDWSQQFFQNNGRLFFLNKKNIVKKNFVKQSKIAELYTVDDSGEFLELGLSLHGFGQDANGEIYVLGNMTGTPFGDTGMVQRIISAEIE